MPCMLVCPSVSSLTSRTSGGNNRGLLRVPQGENCGECASRGSDARFNDDFDRNECEVLGEHIFVDIVPFW